MKAERHQARTDDACRQDVGSVFEGETVCPACHCPVGSPSQNSTPKSRNHHRRAPQRPVLKPPKLHSTKDGEQGTPRRKGIKGRSAPTKDGQQQKRPHRERPGSIAG